MDEAPTVIEQYQIAYDCGREYLVPLPAVPSFRPADPAQVPQPGPVVVAVYEFRGRVSRNRSRYEFIGVRVQ